MQPLVVMLAIGSIWLSVGQEAVGPAVPKQDEPFAARAKTLHPLLSGPNADKIWATGDDAKLNELLKDLVDARTLVEGDVRRARRAKASACDAPAGSKAQTHEEGTAGCDPRAASHAGQGGEDAADAGVATDGK